MFWVIKMDLNWKLNKTEHIVQDEWIDFRKESDIFFDSERKYVFDKSNQREKSR